MTAGIGTGFRAPDATDRFGFGGNPMLEPEQSRNYELGYRLPIHDNQMITINAFYNKIDNLINFVITDPMTFAGENRNVDKARIRGVEASYELSTERWWFRTQAVVQDPENTSDNQRLFRRAKRTLTTSIARQIGPHRLGLQFLASGDRKDFGFPQPTTLGGYVLANATASVALGRDWVANIKIENLLDRDYQTANGFNSAERGIYATLRYSLNR